MEVYSLFMQLVDNNPDETLEIIREAEMLIDTTNTVDAVIQYILMQLGSDFDYDGIPITINKIESEYKLFDSTNNKIVQDMPSFNIEVDKKVESNNKCQIIINITSST